MTHIVVVGDRADTCTRPWSSWRCGRPHRHQRRARPHCRRPHRTGRRRVRRAGRAPRRSLEQRIRAILRRERARCAPTATRGDAGGHAQAGDGSRGRDDPRAGRHRARLRHPTSPGHRADDRRPPRPAASAPAMWARRDADDARLLARATAREQHVMRLLGLNPSSRRRCGAIEDAGVPLSPLDINTCWARGDRDHDPVRAGTRASTTLQPASCSPPRVLARRRDRRRDRHARTARAARSPSSSRHRRAAGRAARRSPRLVLRGSVTLSATETIADAPPSGARSSGTAPAHRRSPWRWPTEPARASTRTPGSASRASRGRVAGGRRSPSGRCACGSPSRVAGRGSTARCSCPGTAAGAGADDDRGLAHASPAAARRVSVRLFVALDLPAEARAALARVPGGGGGPRGLAARAGGVVST